MNTVRLSDPQRALRLSSTTARLRKSPIRELFALLGRSDVISLAGGFPPMEAIDAMGLRNALVRAARDSLEDSLRYGATQGYAPLRALIADRNRVQGIALDAADIQIVSGSQQGIDLAARTLIDSGDIVLAQAPTYLGALQVFHAQGARIETIPADAGGRGIDMDALERQVVALRPKLIYLVPSFANPTGNVLALRERKQLLSLARRSAVPIVEDDPYGALYFHEPPPPSLLALANAHEREWVIHLSSLSKMLAPGLRLAWMTGPPDWMSPMSLVKQIGDTHTSNLSQLVAWHYLCSGALEPALERARLFYRAQAQTMIRAIQREMPALAQTIVAPKGGMFVWGTLPGVDTTALLPEALREGVAYVPGAAFMPGESVSDGLRLSFATASPEHIQEGIRRLARCVSRSR
ncbi:PLP-dependent aminotransferase family protein [Pararobbsia silviterrae]|uniref:aminotransferase-like domain-containing protein n=1 Tax=Pararobbsia silviterrae TaxID=1792498 RepID=UPI001F0CCD02|nr:PLP-dependent aminotransferase family protein [Pararobbsia silviterrae]